MPKGIPKSGINKGWFKKDCIPWIKGRHHSKEANKKNSIAHKGRPSGNKGGYKLSKEIRKQMSIRMKGKPSRAKGKHFNCGSNHPYWKGGRVKDGCGYILIRKINHPFVGKTGYVREHRFMVEKTIGRYLHRWEIVHHINGIRDDNRLKNLMLLKNKSEHQKIHEQAKRELLTKK